MWMNYSNRKPDAVSVENPKLYDLHSKAIEVYRPIENDTHYHFVHESYQKETHLNIRRTNLPDSMIQIDIDQNDYSKKRGVNKYVSFSIPESLVEIFIEAVTTQTVKYIQ